MKIPLLLLISVSSFAQPGVHEHWKNLFNTNIAAIEQAYSPKAVLITSDGVSYMTMPERFAFYAKFKSKVAQIKSVTTLHEEQVNSDVRFEIGYFTTDTKKFMYLIVGKKMNDDLVREAEILSESDHEPLDVTGINNARNEWMRLCNNHRANELVSNAYLSNAVYYNNNRVLVGTADITKEYRYMNNLSYQLTLTPIVVEAAGKDMVFEIGQCSGSYKGKYTLVWKKIGDSWKVLFDSN